MPDGAVLACRIHRLENQQQRMAVGRVVKALQRAQLLNVFSQEFVVPLFRFAKWLHHRRPFPERDVFSRPHQEIL